MIEAVLTFPDIDPVVPLLRVPAFSLGDFTIGPLQLRWYALAYIAGLLLGWLWIVRLLQTPRLWSAERPAPMTAAQGEDYLFWATLGVILGGRLGYVLFYMLPNDEMRAEIARDPLTIVRLWEGGMAFHGGLLGVALATLWFCRRTGAPLLGVGDLVAAAAPIGLFFGRIANFVNGELWGRGSDAPWAMVFCNERVREANGGFCPAGMEPRHPSQLYEAALEGLGLFAIISIATLRFRSLSRPGVNTGLFLVGYGLARAALETVREPDAHMPEALRGTLTMGMILSLPMIGLGAFLLWRALRREEA